MYTKKNKFKAITTSNLTITITRINPVKKYLICNMFSQYFNNRVGNDRLTTFVMLLTIEQFKKRKKHPSNN